MPTSQLPADRARGQDCADSAVAEALVRLGDRIDDRVAEVLPEILAEQAASRPGPNLALAAFGLLVALVATLVLRHSGPAVCVVWPSAAAVCVAAALARRRPRR